jgi:toluene monooxygenase system ferredoxin subunit
VVLKMNLSELITTLPIQFHPSERWAIFGPEAAAFRSKFHLTVGQADNLAGPEPELEGLILAGALSAKVEAETWLKQLLGALRKKSTLVVIEWQGDGPLDQGPDLRQRFKRGRLSRLLRESGFSQIELLADHPIYYMLQAVKEPPAPLPHAGEFVTVATLAELPKNNMKQVEVFGQPLIVANTGREIVAFAQSCPHAGTSLMHGKLRGQSLICPLHYYMWNVYSGEPIEPADEDTLPLYPVRVDAGNGTIQVALSL